MSDESLTAWLGSVSDDPYAYVMGAFPWGEPGTRLADFTGPEPWQEKQLKRIRDKLKGFRDNNSLSQIIQEAIASGHGVGKSALVAWLIKWGMDTKPDTVGVVTANTETQLKTKTWVSLGKWHHMSITKDVFRLTATAYYHPEYERTWRVDMVPWSERNTEAFAGLHNLTRRILLIMDEASAVPDMIWETAEGALTDERTQILWCVYGNPTRNTGRFKECFDGGQFAQYWEHSQVDSREVSFTNKEQIKRWIDAYGDDSDFVRIRVYGMFPRVGEMEFFSADDIAAAMAREAISHISDPLALGNDVARYGKNSSVTWPRKGRDARTYARRRYQGLNTVQFADKIFETNFELHADGIMIDGGGVGGGVVDSCRAKMLYVYEVQFGAKDTVPHTVFGSQGEKYANMRSGMYGAMRSWLKTGMLPDDPEVKKQFGAIKYTFNKKDEIQLISKEDMLKLDPDLELDDIDALATTFATALQPHEMAGGEHPRKPLVEHDYDPVERYEEELRAA
jgi:hypothetical protein